MVILLPTGEDMEAIDQRIVINTGDIAQLRKDFTTLVEELNKSNANLAKEQPKKEK